MLRLNSISLSSTNKILHIKAFMEPKKFQSAHVVKMLGLDIQPQSLLKAESVGRIPKAQRVKRGKVPTRFWTLQEIPDIAKVLGKLPRPSHCQVISTYVPKGGVGKSLWTFNFSRILALNGIKTLVIGSDFQCSISKSFGVSYEDDQEMPLSLYDVLVDGVNIEEVIWKSDIPTLHFIPENTELTFIDRAILRKTRKEYLLSKVIQPLKSKYDVIIIDCPPHWNELTTNALIASNIIVSPVLADGESYHSFKIFMKELSNFLEDAETQFDLVKFIANGVDIRNKYTTSYQKKFLNDYPEVFSSIYIKDSVFLKEATELQMSIVEHKPKSSPAEDINAATYDIWTDILEASKEK